MVHQHLFSVKDFRVMAEAGLFVDQKVELLDGVIVERSTATPEHEEDVHEIRERMDEVFRGRARVREEKAFDIGDDYWLPHPDIMLVKPKRYGDNAPKPEDVFLMIEVANTTLSDDLGKKLKTYASLGIQDYWVVNVRAKKWLIHREPSGDKYLSVTEMTFGTEFAPLSFPEDAHAWL
jgi:Uma2 family endonuclease